jgi:DNA polymerase-3 subunit delta'
MNVDTAFEDFRRSFEGGRIANGYIIVGPPRGAALEFVERATRLLFCTGLCRPCEGCPGCRGVTSRTWPDLFWVEPQKKSRVISVGQMRELLPKVMQTSFVVGWKACVFVSADRLGQEAANALLKTLEEPPARTVFFLLTENPQALLPTILSRCQRMAVSVDISPLRKDWAVVLGDILGDRAQKGLLGAVVRADRVGGLLAIMKDEAEKEVKARVKANPQVDEDDDTVKAMIQACYREYRTGLLGFMLRWYRDLLFVVSGAPEQVYNRPHLDRLKERAEGVTVPAALQNVSTVEGIASQLEQNLGESSVLMNAFSRMM